MLSDPLKHIQLNHYYLSQFIAEMATENLTVVRTVFYITIY
jgi:hypothetical protein